MSDEGHKRGAMGRPRDLRIDAAILDATLALIVEHGVETLRVDDVAERAGVGKAAIYRRYRSRDELLTAAIAVLVREIAIPDTGSTKKDLLALMNDAVQVYGNAPAAQAMPALIAAMNRNPTLAQATREGFLAARRDALREVLARAASSAATSAQTSTSNSHSTSSAAHSSTASSSPAAQSTPNSQKASPTYSCTASLPPHPDSAKRPPSARRSAA